MFHPIKVFFQALVLVKFFVSMYFQLEWKTVWIPICYNTQTTYFPGEMRQEAIWIFCLNRHFNNKLPAFLVC